MLACSGTFEKVKSEAETRRVDTIYIDSLTWTDIEIMGMNRKPIIEVACRYFGSFEWDEYESEAYKIRDSIEKIQITEIVKKSRIFMPVMKCVVCFFDFQHNSFLMQKGILIHLSITNG